MPIPSRFSPAASLLRRARGVLGGHKTQRLTALGVGAGVATMGTAAAVTATSAAAYEAYHTSQGWKQSREAAHMTNVLSTMQVGPFGTGNRPYGMGSNYGNASGMSLALHYARNGTGVSNPVMSMAGMLGPTYRRLGGMI